METAFIGIGRMGMAIVHRVVEVDHTVNVYIHIGMGIRDVVITTFARTRHD